MLDNARYVDQLREGAAAWPGRASLKAEIDLVARQRLPAT
jgi:hypothetical protein